MGINTLEMRPGVLLGPEDQRPAGRPFNTLEASLFGAAERVDNRKHLENLPYQGFVSEAQRQDVITLFDDIGIAPDNLTSLRYVPKDPDQKDDGVLASFGTGKENFGQLSIHELLYKMPREKLVGTGAHELAHSVSPSRPENAHIYGGEVERLKALQRHHDFAGQTLETRVFLNGYQKSLAEQLDPKNPEDVARFIEESAAIAIEFALTNRAKLLQVQQAQNNKAAKMKRSGDWSSDRDPIVLVSSEGPDGHTETAGFDEEVIAITGDTIKNPADIVEHVARLKAKYYPKEGNSAAVARERAEKQAVNGSRWQLMAKVNRDLFSKAVTTDAT